jgi:hypothetical protein
MLAGLIPFFRRLAHPGRKSSEKTTKFAVGIGFGNPNGQDIANANAAISETEDGKRIAHDTATRIVELTKPPTELLGGGQVRGGGDRSGNRRMERKPFGSR